MKIKYKSRRITRPIKVRKEAGGPEKKADEKAAVLRPGQFKELMIRTARGQNPGRNVAMLWHSFGSGLRVTEIAQLRVKDVINQSGTIKEAAQLPAKFAKNGKARHFFQVDPAHRAALDAYLNYRVQNGIRTSHERKQFRGLQPDSPLYIASGASGFSLTTKLYKRKDGGIEKYEVCSSLQQLLTKLIKKVGVIGGSSHSGRRTMATRMDARGIDPGLVQLILGHSEKNQTMDYIEPHLPHIRKAMAAIYQGI